MTRAEIAEIGKLPGADTTLREPRAELQASEERTRTLFAMSPDGISVVDQTGRILACNEQFAQIHGYEHGGEIIGRYAAEFTTPEGYTRLFREVAAGFGSGQSVVKDIEVEVFKRDGTTVTTEYSVAQVPWPDAPAGVAFISNIRDTTKRKALLAELEHHRAHLEDLIQERTRDSGSRDRRASRGTGGAAAQRSEPGRGRMHRASGQLGDRSGNRRTSVVRRDLSHLWLRSAGALLAPTESFWERLHPDDRDAGRSRLCARVGDGGSFDSILPHHLAFGRNAPGADIGGDRAGMTEGRGHAPSRHGRRTSPSRS